MLINVVSTTIAAATSSSYPNCTANTEDIDAQGHASRIITTSATIPLILNILKIKENAEVFDNIHTTGIMNILTIIAKYTSLLLNIFFIGLAAIIIPVINIDNGVLIAAA